MYLIAIEIQMLRKLLEGLNASSARLPVQTFKNHLQPAWTLCIETDPCSILCSTGCESTGHKGGNGALRVCMWMGSLSNHVVQEALKLSNLSFCSPWHVYDVSQSNHLKDQHRIDFAVVY